MTIRTLAIAGALFALALPSAGFAQEGPPAGGPGAGMFAQFQKLRDDTKTAALNDLTPDHRAKVQAIFAQEQSGQLDPRDAATQIDAILTPDEAQKVLGEQQKMRDAIRTQMQANGGDGGFGGNGGSHMGGSRMGGQRKPDAGRFLSMLARPPRQEP
jgi:Spy/CpxP family protein refolding chaperone